MVRVGRTAVVRGSILLALGAALAASCLRDASGPGAGRAARLALAPTFTGGAAGVVDFDRVRVTVLRVASSVTRAPRTVVDTVIPFPAGVDSIELVLLVPLEAPSETFQVFIRFVTAAGDTVFRNDPYPQQVVAYAGSRSAVLEAILIYVGIGFDATALVIATPDTLISSGQTLDLAADVLDSGGQPIPGAPVAWRSLDPAVAAVPAAAVGQLVGGTQRGRVRIVATTPTGLADSIWVDVVPLPAQLQIVSGDGQAANAGGTLPLPLRVRVTGSDGRGVPALVRFRALAGGSPADVVVVTDATGFAELTVSLGPVLGKQQFEASAAGLAPVAFTAYAMTSVALPFVVFAGDSSAGASSGVFRVNGDGSDRARLSDLGRSGQVYPRQSRDHGRAAFGFDVSGLGTNELLVTARTGDTVASLVRDTSTRRPRWNADGTSLAFECGDGFSPRQDVCVIPDVTGPIAALNGIGDGSGKLFVTDFTGDKLDGPGSFAWDPRDPKRLIVVRDSVTDQALVASRLWTVGSDGSAAAPLSPPVLDAGKGPLRVDGPLDVTADGKTIVFSALDPGGSRSLYLLNGAEVRPLTAGPNDWNPVFSPDGRQVLFLRDAGCSADYWLINLDGTGERRVSDERFCAFDLTALGHDWSPDGKEIVLAGRDAQGHTLIYRLALGATDYFKDRVLIGRGVNPGGNVTDIQPSWRP